jgi:predicted small secreted protein
MLKLTMLMQMLCFRVFDCNVLDGFVRDFQRDGQKVVEQVGVFDKHLLEDDVQFCLDGVCGRLHGVMGVASFFH